MKDIFYYHDDRFTQYLAGGDIFVFGSNRAGIHGAGAAKTARHSFGAGLGVGEGRMGRSYGIPTKDEEGFVLSLEEIQKHVINFIDAVTKNPQLKYYITTFGTGYAGYSDEAIASLFSDLYGPWAHACVWPEKWMAILGIHGDSMIPYWVDNQRNPAIQD